MRKMTGFIVSGLLLIALAAPAWAADTGSATGQPSGDEAAAAATIAPVGTAPAMYEPNRHGYHRDRHDRDGRYYRDGRWYHYRDGRYHYRDGRYHYRDGRYHYRDGYYYGDDNYYRGRPTPDCPSGEWAYHPNTGWMCTS
jgi:hypothetical protein